MQQENDIFFKYPAGHYVLKSFSMLSVHLQLHNFLLIWMHRSSISSFRNHLRGQMKYLCHPPQGQGGLTEPLAFTSFPDWWPTCPRLVKGWMEEVRFSARSSSKNNAETPKKKTNNPHVKKKKSDWGAFHFFTGSVFCWLLGLKYLNMETYLQQRSRLEDILMGKVQAVSCLQYSTDSHLPHSNQ